MKIYVLGQSGSGKTYFSRLLAEKTGITLLEMDELHYKVGYDLPKFYELINKELDHRSVWIVDGKYKGIRKRLIMEADQIYYLDLPFWRSMLENIHREFKQTGGLSRPFLKHLGKVAREFSSVRKEIYHELEGNEDKLTVIKSRAEANRTIDSL